MPGLTKVSYYEEQKNYTIYVILEDPTPNAYVWQTSNPDLKTVFEKHYFGKIAGTKTMFEEGKAAGKPPRMYRLETVYGTGEQVFKHSIVWTRYFMSYGYTNQNRRLTKAYLCKLFADTQALEDRIKDLPFHEAISDELFANYGNRRKKHDPNEMERRHISFVVKPEEYEKIATEANKRNMKISAFAKKRTLEGKVHKINFEELCPISDSLQDVIRRLDDTLYSICVDRRYYPSDLEKIEALVSEVSQLRDQAMEIIRKERNRR